MARTGTQHLEWAIERALEQYSDQATGLGLPGDATTSFLDDVAKHHRTAFIAVFPHALELLEAARLQGREKFVERMRGWDVRD